MAALDDLLDLILLAMAVRTHRHLFHCIPTKLFDLGRVVLVFIAAIANPLCRLRRRPLCLDGICVLARKGYFDGWMDWLRHQTGIVPCNLRDGFGGRLESRFDSAIWMLRRKAGVVLR